MERVHEGAGAVVDGLACNRQVVGVHHAMNEADQLPARDKLRRAVDHRFQQRAIWSLRPGRVRVVSGDHIVGEKTHGLRIAPVGEELEGADSHMTLGDAGQHSAGLKPLAQDLCAGGHHGKRAGGPNAEGGHRLADDVLAQNGAERGAAVAHARERSPARALELDVTANPISVVHLAKQHRTAVAKLRHPVAKLMPGIGHREGFGPFRQPVARQHLHTVRRGKPVRVDPEMPGEVIVQPDQPRGGHRGRRKPREEPLRQARITIVKCHVRPEAMRGTGEGHYPWDLKAPEHHDQRQR
jgi:hypothetical protein